MATGDGELETYGVGGVGVGGGGGSWGGAGEFVFGGEVYDPAEFSWFLVEPLEESPIVFLFLFFFALKIRT